MFAIVDYEAFWIAESRAAADLALGEQWLRASNYPGKRLIVLNSSKIVKDIPPLAEIVNRHTVVTPRMKKHPSRGGHAVFAPWVVGKALELAEELESTGGGLCVIDSAPRADEIAGWLLRTQATKLTRHTQRGVSHR